MMDVAKARREMALDQLRTRFGGPQPPVGALNPRNPSDMDVIGWALAELLECAGDEATGAAAMAQGGDVPSPHADTQVGDGMEPATDEDIAYYAAHPGPLSAQRVGELVARVRQEQARVRQVERERDNALADLQAMSRGVGELLTERSQARLERDEAMTRAKAAEAALARRIDAVRGELDAIGVSLDMRHEEPLSTEDVWGILRHIRRTLDGDEEGGE